MLIEAETDLPVLIEAQAIQKRVAELAEKVKLDYQDTSLLLVGVLKGSLHFLSDLSRLLPGPVEIDFIQVSSYGNGSRSSGVVQIRKDLDTNIQGRDVLLVEDVVDTGATLRHLRELLGTRRPKTLRVVSLLSKLKARGINDPIEYVGFDIPDQFVVGYGLDYGERYRNLPYIATFREP